MFLFGSVRFVKNNFHLIAVSTFTKGEQMVPVLNDVGTICAVFGNHDFGKNFTFKFFLLHHIANRYQILNIQYFVDHGLEVLAKHTEKTNFPWLMSNVIGKAPRSQIY